MTGEPTPRTKLTHIGEWTLGKTLGRGAYAHVRLATHISGHQAACKILPALHHGESHKVSWDQTIDAVEAHKEVVLLKALWGADVKGIVGLEGVMEEGGWTFVFLALYPHSASAVATPWDLRLLVPFFRNLLSSIDALHSLDISHEDLKRSNVLLDDRGQPVLVDFGFSHFKAGGGLVKSAGGTLDYSSPEKVADIPYDPKANDVWAMGVLLVKLLGLPHPFVSGTDDDCSKAVRNRIIEGDVQVQWDPRRIPNGFSDLLEGMLERNPRRRWTIPMILAHPILRRRTPDHQPYKTPSFDVSFHMKQIPTSVVQDLSFLAYLNADFALCETALKIRQRLYGPQPCWEKRWAGMLCGWLKRSSMEWVDIPQLLETPKPRRAPSRDALRLINQGRPLREIHLSPNVQSTVMRSIGQVAVPKTMAKAASATSAKGTLQTRPRSLLLNMKTKEASVKCERRAEAEATVGPTRSTISRPDQTKAAKQTVVTRTSDVIVIATPRRAKRFSMHERSRRPTAKTQTRARPAVHADLSALTDELPKPHMPPKYATAGARSREPSMRGSDSEMECPPTPPSPSDLEESDAGTRTKVAIKIRTTNKAGSSPPNEQLHGLLLLKPETGNVRRRSPRLLDASKGAKA